MRLDSGTVVCNFRSNLCAVAVASEKTLSSDFLVSASLLYLVSALLNMRGLRKRQSSNNFAEVAYFIPRLYRKRYESGRKSVLTEGKLSTK